MSLAFRKTVSKTPCFSERDLSTLLHHPICKWEPGSPWIAEMDASEPSPFVHRGSAPLKADYSHFKHNQVRYRVSQPMKDEGLSWQEGEEDRGRQSDSKQIRALGAVDSFHLRESPAHPPLQAPWCPMQCTFTVTYLCPCWVQYLGCSFLGSLGLNHLLIFQHPTQMAPSVWNLPLHVCTLVPMNWT